jgi:predicted cupin superfamily sugar epimerase
MHPRAEALIRSLGLRPLVPEGGYFADVFHSPRRVTALDRPGERDALSAIYFLLTAADHSRWHRLRSDEVWCHLEGDPLLLHSFRAETHEHSAVRLGPLRADARPVHTIPAGLWQAAEPLGDYALVSTVCAPGFEMTDCTFLADDPENHRLLRAHLPALVHLIS